MRLEVRKSGGPECTTCGSYEPVKILGTVDAAHDLSQMVEAEWGRREQEIREGYEGKVEERDERIKEALPLAVAQPRPRALQFLRRRWQDRLESQIQAAVDDLLAQTRL